ncbi:MAG: hypothetical protein IJ230_05320 [Clostridia bacterium]|nr:hypothetical protein [Clostridia bacterium]
MTSRMKKVLSLILAVCMLLTVGALNVFADYKKPYKVYASFGDSIAAGLGLPDYHTTYDETSGTLGDGDRIPGSYPDIVASAVNAELRPMARQGFRSNELRLVLDDTYYGDTITALMLPALSPNYAGMSAEQVIGIIKGQKAEFVKAIDDSELITIQLGSNDLMESVMLQLFVTAWGYPVPGREPAQQVQYLLNRFGSVGKVYEYLAKEISGYRQSDTSLGALLTAIWEDENVQTLLSTTQTLAGFLNTILDAQGGFKENMTWNLDYMTIENPNAEIIVVGLYNPFRDSQLNSSIPLKLGRAMDIVLETMNIMLRNIAAKYDNVTYVTSWDAEVIATMNLDEIDVNDQAFFQKVSSYVHPNLAGHAYIAEEILKAIPDVWEGRWVRKNPKDGKWYLYNDNKIVSDYTGVAKNENGWWYIKNGKVDFTYTGFASNENGTWRIVHGKVAFNENGLTGEGKDWRYVKGGKVDPTANGVYKNQFGWYKVTNGKIDFNFKGIAKNQNGWWYLEGGRVVFLKFGRVTVDANNNVAKKGTTYQVFGGRVLK